MPNLLEEAFERDSMALLTQFAEAEIARREAEDVLDRAKARAKTIENALMENMLSMGVESARCSGLTIFVHKQLWARKNSESSTQDVCDCLKEVGLTSLVHEAYNTQSLSALMREWEREGQEMPAALSQVVSSEIVTSLRSRRS